MEISFVTDGPSRCQYRSLALLIVVPLLPTVVAVAQRRIALRQVVFVVLDDVRNVQTGPETSFGLPSACVKACFERIPAASLAHSCTCPRLVTETDIARRLLFILRASKGISKVL